MSEASAFTQVVTLEGRFVRLEPLSPAHAEALWSAAQEDHARIFHWTVRNIDSLEAMRQYIMAALEEQRQGTSLPFCSIHLETKKRVDLGTQKIKSGRAAGSTRFLNMDAANRRVEIGNTWLGTRFQRTALNTEAKYLMLRHAFETLGCMRVELKTDSLNESSRRAILRLGAVEEGVFRNHQFTQEGRVRHTVWYSIIDSEWPAVKAGLEEKLARSAAAGG